jgi:hypothetical protein
LNAVKQSNTNKLRLIEINDYFGDIYEDQSWIMKIIVIISLTICLLCGLHKIGLPEKVFYLCLAITFVVGSYFLVRKIVDVSYRDNMNYQEYAWQHSSDPNSIVPANATAENPWYAESNVSCPVPAAAPAPSTTPSTTNPASTH